MEEYLNPFDEVNTTLMPKPNPLPENTDNKHELLYLYENDTLIYITRSPQLQFLRDKQWWIRVDNIKIKRFPTPGQAEDAKFTAIKEDNPLFNIHRG